MKLETLRKEEALPVIIADVKGEVLYINARFQETFLWRPEDLVGGKLTKVIPDRLTDAHNMGFSRYLVTGQATLLDQPLDLTIVTRDGRELEAEHVISAGRENDRVVFGATIRLKDAGGN